MTRIVAIPPRSTSIWAAVVCTLLTTLFWVAVAIPASARFVQVVDDRWRDTMVALGWPAMIGLAHVLAFVGGAWVTAPLRLLVALWLWSRKRWVAMSTWLLAVVPAQAISLIGKALYDRARPDDRLAETFSASFPSGHSTNAAVMALTLVFILVPPGVRRRRWLMLAVGYALLMAASRTYLRVHWLSDVTGGLLLGTSCALWSTLLAQRLAVNNAGQIRSKHRSGS